MTKEALKIEGMYCENCASRIEKGLRALPGVSACRVDYAKGEAAVVYDAKTASREALCERVRELGYEVARDASRQAQIVSILVSLLALYLIANHLGWLSVFNVFPVIETTMSCGAVFVIGLLTSVHCIAMCGGINLTQSVLSAERKDRLLHSNLLYNLGRVCSYTLVGGVVGAIGGAVSIGGRFRGVVAIGAGVVMLGMALRMLGVCRGLRTIRLPAFVYRLGGGLLKGRSSFAIGLLNGLMPCGPLQSMQLYALSTGSFLGGALSMLLFSLGTVPLMFGFGALSGGLNRRYAKHMLTVSALLIFVPEGRLNGCNGEILVQEYGLDVKLHEGENVVHFTPGAAGTVPYSCWMGMIRSSIQII